MLWHKDGKFTYVLCCFPWLSMSFPSQGFPFPHQTLLGFASSVEQGNWAPFSHSVHPDIPRSEFISLSDLQSYYRILKSCDKIKMPGS